MHTKCKAKEQRRQTPFARHTNRSDDNIKMDLEDTGHKVVAALKQLTAGPMHGQPHGSS